MQQFGFWLKAAALLTFFTQACSAYAQKAIDLPGERFFPDRPPSPEIAAIVARLTPAPPQQGQSRAQRLAEVRRQFDALFDARVANARFIAVDSDGVRGEWVLAPGADPARRLLFVHGGGFRIGSPRSHRAMTTRLSALLGGAVLALDYRLMPEHSRMDGIDDARQAYGWMLRHGPQGVAPPSAVLVAGDSAGANLSLSLLAWVRDRGLRAPDGAVLLSPPTDTTLSSPSVRANIPTDLSLGKVAGFLGWVPRSVIQWYTWLNTGIRPNDPLISPVFGDLSRLPPLLVQVSETEMLYDDARRYVNRARAAGSPVRLQSWNHALHVWHMFDDELPEAREAYAEIGKFFAACAPAAASTSVKDQS